MNEQMGVAVRLQGPMQAWGGPVIGDNRPSLPFPTRSGVLGIVAACMGIRRTDHERLAELADGTRVHVRVDLPGIPLVDDQTIQDNPNASTTRQTIQSKRQYLCDASFIAVVVPGPHVRPEQIALAIEEPTFQPYLGRRTCVPAMPLFAGHVQAEDDPLNLFDGLPREPTQLVDRVSKGQEAGSQDFYLDLDDHPEKLRRLPIRDHLAGPLPRQFRERWVVHVKRALGPPGESTAEPWFTSELL